MNTQKTQDTVTKWDTIYQTKISELTPKDLPTAYVLRKFQHLLPNQGHALDLACGLGGNALFLAQQNLQTYAWDISPTAIKQLKKTALSKKLDIHASVRNILKNPPEKNSFDVIIVSYFLERKIMPNIITALRKNGLLFYQTFTVNDSPTDLTTGPKNQKYRLAKNELLHLCQDLHIIAYQEENRTMHTKLPHEALLVGQRKPNHNDNV